MSQGRHGIKVLGLSLIAALGLMAFMAAAAQASSFTIEGKVIAANESIEGTVAAGKLLVPGLGIAFVCTGGTATGTIEPAGKASATILYSGCTVENQKLCKVYETKSTMETEVLANQGFIKASGTGELVLMGKKNEKGEEVAPFTHYLLVSSASFATIYLSTAKATGCPLPLENAVGGSTVLLAPTALTPKLEQTLTALSEAELKTLFPTHKLLYGTQESWLDGGTATAHLSGAANKGKTWGGE